MTSTPAPYERAVGAVVGSAAGDAPGAPLPGFGERVLRTADLAALARRLHH
ncbi:hypothetical protein ACIF80_28730 [Streptomyces sp. NPDC085927]|uniref:hypothetical protein n=1 Tax=Streptomyces sp. NPDC085927 TaxID=3365738 RepID=UPI0037CF09C8